MGTGKIFKYSEDGGFRLEFSLAQKQQNVILLYCWIGHSIQAFRRIYENFRFSISFILNEYKAKGEKKTKLH